jgi:peptidoglycan hydrolase CwlO-like protein
MGTIIRETAAEIIRTKDDMLMLQKQITKTQEKLKSLEAALKKVESNVHQPERRINAI